MRAAHYIFISSFAFVVSFCLCRAQSQLRASHAVYAKKADLHEIGKLGAGRGSQKDIMPRQNSREASHRPPSTFPNQQLLPQLARTTCQETNASHARSRGPRGPAILPGR